MADEDETMILVGLCAAMASVLCLSATVWSTQAFMLQHMNHRKNNPFSCTNMSLKIVFKKSHLYIMYMQNCFKYMILEELFTHVPACGTRHRQGTHGGSAWWVHLDCGRCHLFGSIANKKLWQSIWRATKNLILQTVEILGLPRLYTRTHWQSRCPRTAVLLDSLQRMWLQIRPPAKGTADNYCHPKSELT